MQAHTLVATAFYGPRPDGMECCHRDGDKKNNRADNLRWGTKEDNRFEIVLHGSNRGTRNGRSKLNVDDVAEIRKLYKAGGRRSVIARTYGLSWTTVNHIIKGILWNHIPANAAE